LKAVAVNKINEFRPLFEEQSIFKLTDACHLAKLIPTLAMSMQKKTHELLKDRSP
jgi:hypothetical protein